MNASLHTQFSSPEMELLCECARVGLDEVARKRIRELLLQPLDWGQVLLAAERHRIAPLLHKHLSALQSDSVPREALSDLASAARLSACRGLWLASELQSLVQDLCEQGIPAVPFKGPTLAIAAYGSLALRPSVDLDLLVREQDALRASELLLGLGYQHVDPIEAALSPRQRKHFLREECSFSFAHPGSRANIDLHWRFVPRRHRFEMNVDNLFERLSEVSFGAIPVPALPQADLLLVLCLHGAKHRWYSLGWICDVAELIRCDLDWDDLFARADRLGVRRILSLGLHLAAGLLRAPVPAPIRRVVESDLAVGRLAVEVQENLLNEGAASWGTWEVSTFYLRCRERLADRLWFTAGEALTLTAGDFAFWPLPDRLFRLYHLIRPVRLAAKYAHRVLPERERSKA